MNVETTTEGAVRADVAVEEGGCGKACVEAGRRSPRLDRGSQEKKAKIAVRFKSCTLEGWPSDVDYTNTPDMSEVSPADKRLLRQDYIPGVSIRRVETPGHPAFGQYGLYATINFVMGDVLGEYTGKVMPGHWGGEYVTRLWNTGAKSDYYRPGVDAQLMGNELRMINDYRGVPGATGPNCKFSRTAIRGYRAALIVAIAPIAPDQEFLLDYGEVYWRQDLMEGDGYSSIPGSPQAGGVNEAAVSLVLPSDLEALENDLREMVAQATEGED